MTRANEDMAGVVEASNGSSSWRVKLGLAVVAVALITGVMSFTSKPEVAEANPWPDGTYSLNSWWDTGTSDQFLDPNHVVYNGQPLQPFSPDAPGWPVYVRFTSFGVQQDRQPDPYVSARLTSMTMAQAGIGGNVRVAPGGQGFLIDCLAGDLPDGRCSVEDNQYTLTLSWTARAKSGPCEWERQYGDPRGPSCPDVQISGSSTRTVIGGQAPPDESLTPTCEIVSQTGPGGSDLTFEADVETDDPGYLQEWTFSDGTKSTANLVSRTATKPGIFKGTFRAWRPGTDIDESVSCEAEVKAPQLGVALVFPGNDTGSGVPNSTFEVGKKVPFQLKLKATSDGVGDLTDVGFVGDPLQVNPGDAIVADSGPTPEIPATRTLAPGEEVTYDYELTVVKPGEATLTSKATSLDAIGRTVGPVTASRTVRGGALKVETTITPNAIDLEEDEDSEDGGPIPEPVKVKIEVTNPLPEDVTDATLRFVEPQLITQVVPPPGYQAFSYLVAPPEPAEGEPPSTDPVPGVPEDLDLGTIEAGGKVTKEVDALALNGGSVDLTHIVRGTVGGARTSGSDTERIEIRAEVEFAFDAEIDTATTGPSPGGTGDGWVAGGGSWEVDGTFENRTHDKTLEVIVMPLLENNAAYGVPVPNDTLPPDRECGIGIHRSVGPGETIRWAAPVTTGGDGGTRSTVKYQPKVFEVKEDGTRPELAASKVLVTPGSGEHEVSVDTRDRLPEPAAAGDILWAYSDATITAIGESFSGMAQLAIAATKFSLNPWAWDEAYAQAGNKVSEYVLNVYENLSPADKAAWNADWTSAVAFATGQSLVDARGAVDRLALESFSELGNAWRTGDSVAVARWWGTLTGNNIDTVLGGLTKAYGVCKLMSTKTPWAKAALAAKEAKIAKEVAELGVGATARTIPTGATINRAQRRAIWGIDDVMYAKVQAFVDEFELTIGVRRRGPGSIDKIESGTHYPKSYYNKAKNITRTDSQFLGFADDLDTSAIKQPPPRSAVIARLNAAGASKDLRAQVLARHQTRMKEWYGKGVDLETGLGGDFASSQLGKWESYVRDGFPQPKKQGGILDYTENVSKGTSVPPDDVLYERIPAEIRTTIRPDGRPQKVLYVDRGQGMKPMTGDMDPVVVANKDFSLLSEAKRIEFYERAHELGFEHVESASWNNPGRNEYIEEFNVHTRNSEALFTWVPGQEARATRFDPQKSWVDPADDELANGFIHLQGTMVALKSAKPEVGREIGDDDPNAVVSPKTIFLIDENCPGPAPAPDARPLLARGAALRPTANAEATSCPIVFDRGPDAVVLRQTLDGKLERWTAEDGWQPFTIAAAGPVKVLPQSVATEGAPAGATEVEIADADDLGLEGGLDTWFAVGDLVVLDPGGPNEQYAVIGAFGSLIFTEPLAEPVPAGTLISVVDPRGDPDDPADPNGPQAPAPPVEPTTPPTPTTPTVPTTPPTIAAPTSPVTPTGPAGSPTAPSTDAVATGTLPRTGSELGSWWIGLCLVGAGGLVLALRRRVARPA